MKIFLILLKRCFDSNHLLIRRYIKITCILYLMGEIISVGIPRQEIIILSQIPPSDLKTIFGWSEDDQSDACEMFSLINTSRYHKLTDTERYDFEKMFFDVSEYLYHKTLPLEYETEMVEDIPTSQYVEDVIYTERGFSAIGTWGQVDLNVSFNGTRGVIKHMLRERELSELIRKNPGEYTRNIPKYEIAERKKKYGKVVFFNESIYELVIQLYLSINTRMSEYKGLTVPRLHWVRRTRGHTLDVFMGHSPGVFLIQIRRNVLLALAHVMKHLWRLQINEQFMHRDFHGGNVSFDASTLEVGIIDFGMACVNPNQNLVAWQANNPDFYPLIHGSRAVACTNRSSDVCCLIASIEHAANSEYLSVSYQEMLVDMKKIVSSASKSKRKIFNDNSSYTRIHKHKEWQLGNKMSSSRNQHFWTYEMVEFPCPNWYPEVFLGRLLEQLPIKDWFPIRKNIAVYFDQIMPKNVWLKSKVGSERGKLLKLHKTNMLKVKIGKDIVIVLADDMLVIPLKFD